MSHDDKSADASKPFGDRDALRQRLSDDEWHVTQEAGTERAFTGRYWDEKALGTYRCVVCGTALFDSGTKYDSGSGWPSFWAPIAEARVAECDDDTHGMRRTEVRCQNCESHLGHLFPDGPAPTGLRYCINSVALDLERRDDREARDGDSSTET